MSMLGLGSPRGHAVDPSAERGPPTPNTVMKAMYDHVLEDTEQFKRSIDKFMGLPSKTPDVVCLLPDPQFKKEQQSEGAGSRKCRYGGSAKYSSYPQLFSKAFAHGRHGRSVELCHFAPPSILSITSVNKA